MQGKGIVIKTGGTEATVRIRKSSACGHDCGECRVCNNPEIEINVANTIGAKDGDTVIIGADTSSVLWNASLLYILPVIGMFVIYMVLNALPAYVTILSVAIWIVLWFAFMRRKSKNTNIKSCILEVVHEKN